MKIHHYLSVFAAVDTKNGQYFQREISLMTCNFNLQEMSTKQIR